MENYQEIRAQRTNIGSSYSFWYNCIQGVSKGSVFGLLLFNIFLNNSFVFTAEI